MTDQTTETHTIIYKYMLDAQDAITKAKALEEETAKIKEQMKAMANQSGQSFKNLASALQSQNLQQYNAQLTAIQQNLAKGTITQQQATQAVNQAKIAYTQTSQAISQASQQLSGGAKMSLGSFTALASGIGAALGISAINIVRNFFTTFINYCNAAIQTGYEFVKGLYQINVGVNALRRAGTDITFGEVLEQLKKLKSEFGIFSTKELVVGASAFLNLNRDMGFTKEQLFALQEAIATLAVVNGRSMEEVQRTVALALSSGYTEGLQRLGVSINRVTIAEKAAQLGYADSYMALTELQRAEATRILILEKTAVYEKDLLEYQKTLPGQIDTTAAAIVDVNAKTGESLLEVKLLLEQLKLAWADFVGWVVNNSIVIEFLKEVEDIIQKTQHPETIGTPENAQSSWDYILKPFSQIGKVAEDGTVKIKNFTDALEEANRRSKEWNDWIAGNLNKMPTEEAATPPEVAERTVPPLTDEQIDAVNSAGQKLIDIQTQYDIDRRDLAIDLQRDLAQIEAEGNDKLVELAADHADKMLDIANRAADDIFTATTKYNLDVKQTWDDYYNNLTSAAEKHNNKLLKIEADYQEKLLRLREGFLLDMEDALQARDARQVLNLIRNYNVQRDQARRERDENLRDESTSYKEQLNELDRQRNDRLKKLKEEFELRTNEIIRQRDKELAMEVMTYTKRKLEQEHENEVEKGERLQKYQEDLDDLALHLQDRLKALAADTVEEAKITSTGMQSMYDIINSYIGPGGATLELYDYFVQYAQAAMAAAMAAATTQWTGGTIGNYDVMPSVLPGYAAPNQPNPFTVFPSGPHAEGGIELANKPTSAIFGEAGPELALFIPINKLLGGASAKSKPDVASREGKDRSKVQVEIMLEPGLEGRIIDKTMDNVASVVLRRVRQ